MVKWIWQQSDWPHFTWKDEYIQPLLRAVRLKQGLLLGKTGLIREEITSEFTLDNLLQNIITSSAIEGEQLNIQSVRSSLAKRLGISLKGAYPVSKRSEALAQIMLDVINNLDSPLTLNRLFKWHEWLFSDNKFSLYPVEVGQLRGEEPMQVVSGRIDKPTVHFEAPPRNVLENELALFINWFNKSQKDKLLDPLLRSGVCHFWFITLHPFDDGNGRITRALTDLVLAQDNQQSIRLYTMSAAILSKRKEYYKVLETSQRAGVEITPWLIWFLNILEDSLQSAITKIDTTLTISRFWQRFQEVELSVEQKKVLHSLLDDKQRFEEGISASQYQKIAKVSKATATRHLTDLVAKGCIKKLPGGGRNTRYTLS